MKLLFVMLVLALSAAVDLRAQSEITFGAKYVVAEGSQLHTTQVFGTDPGPLLDQIDAAARRLSGKVVKLHVVATDNAAVTSLATEVGRRYASSLPAVTCVVGKLSSPDRKLGVDAVIAFHGKSSGARVEEDPLGRILHAGPRVYVSGQAEKGDTPEEATNLTLKGLLASVESLTMTIDDIVQVKAFITPIVTEKRVRAQVEKFFGSRRVPLVIVEWSAQTPVEIELVAASPPGSEPATVQYLTPLGMFASPLYSRAVRIQSDKTIYIGGLYARGSGPMELPADAEVKDIYASMVSILQETGSDLDHLVKATYYCSSGATSSQLNALRPNYYNPQRPPAASKVTVASVGRPGRFLTIDMIAAPIK